jgi:hypothetical protein
MFVMKKRILLITIILITFSLWADNKPSLALAIGWSGVNRTDKSFKEIYPSFSMSPYARLEIGLFSRLTVYAAADLQLSNIITDPDPGFDSKLKILYSEYGAAWRISGRQSTLIPHAGIGIVYLREEAFGEKFNRRVIGFTVGIAWRGYFSEKAFIDINADYLDIVVPGYDDRKIQLGGLRLRVGVGTHIRLFESPYSVE